MPSKHMRTDDSARPNKRQDTRQASERTARTAGAHSAASTSERSGSAEGAHSSATRATRSADTGAAHSRASVPTQRRATAASHSRASQASYGAADVATRGKKRKRSIARIASNVLIGLGLAFLLASGGMWGYSRYRYWRQGQINEQLAKHVVVLDDAQTAEAPGGCPFTVDWAALKAVNDDVVGWINVPGTVVNYPVYQGSSNDEYLRTNAFGDYSVGGQVFLDYQNTSPGMLDHQSILYGHHLWDGTMFQPLTLLDNQEVFDATETIWYVTEQATYELEPLFMYYTDPYDENVRRFAFGSDAEFQQYLMDLLTNRAVTQRADAAQLIPFTTHVLTMSTCNYYDGYGRSILVAVPKDVHTASQQAPVEQEAYVDPEAYTEEAYGEETYTEEETYYEEEPYYEEESNSEDTYYEEETYSDEGY